MSVPNPATTDWVPFWNLGSGSSLPSPVVNGQWIKGAGGVPVWAAITPADIAVTTNKFIKGVGGVGSSGDIAANDVPAAFGKRIGTASQSASASGFTPLAMATNYLTGGFSAPDSYRLTLPATGPYLFYLLLLTAAGGGADRNAFLQGEGSLPTRVIDVVTAANASSGVELTGLTINAGTAGDTFYLYYYNSLGSALTIVRCEFGAIYLGHP